MRDGVHRPGSSRHAVHASRTGIVLAVAALAAASGSGCGTKPPETSSPSRPRAYATQADLTGVDPSVLRGRRIVIDPGHGGRFAGVTGRDSTREADVNLGVALHLWGLLRDAGADVHLTRHSDRDLLAEGRDAVRDDLAARVAILDSLQPDVFLSLHHNSNAALDRERNAIETYYKLDDDGPSYDLGRAIHAELVRHLGIDEARLRPGNYFVLRGARSAAVLGEASYLSNPRVEAQLRLAENHRLEAAAYFRGLIDYFAHGVSAIEKRVPASDTLGTDGRVVFTAGEALDPATIELTAGGVAVATTLDADGRGFSARLPRVPGAHVVAAQARLARGNAARPWLDTLYVYVPAAHAYWNLEPTARGGRARLRARIVDAAGRTVADGAPVRWRVDNGRLLDGETATRDGEALGVVQATAAEAVVHVESDAARASVRVPRASGSALHLVRCVDARDERPLADAWGANGAGSDRRGWLAVAVDSSLHVERNGYVPWQGALPSDSTLRLEPLHGGVLHGVRIVLDPFGNGGDSALPGYPFAAADAGHDVCSRLASQLNASGAVAVLTRGRAGAATDVERVRHANGAQWFVRVEPTVESGAPSVLHYPGSDGGARVATAIARAWGARRGRAVPVRAEARFVLQQTPCPAVWVRVPAADCATLAGVRDLAYALATGLRITLDPQAAAWLPLLGRIEGGGADLVRIDRAGAVPVGADGRFRFEHVAPGRRWLDAIGERPRAVTVQVVARDTTRVVIPAP